MKVNDPNLSSVTSNSLASSGLSKSAETARASQGTQSGGVSSSGQGGDDIHLSELVRSLRSLAADSPQRQEHLEKLARSYATGTYQVDPSATAAKIIDDAIQH
jgi:anti-sigma28 factor (negative regulator of flagellin synthesis)